MPPWTAPYRAADHADSHLHGRSGVNLGRYPVWIYARSS